MKNKINKIKNELLVTLPIIIIVILLLNPFEFWMPDMMVMCMLAILLVMFGLFSIFILREKVIDEREEKHRMIAGRNSFLAGSAILTLGILVQGYNHEVDPWLVLTLLTMIIVKLYSRIWSDDHM